MRESPSRLKYQALQTALAAKTLRITEMSAGGEETFAVARGSEIAHNVSIETIE